MPRRNGKLTIQAAAEVLRSAAGVLLQTHSQHCSCPSEPVCPDILLAAACCDSTKSGHLMPSAPRLQEAWGGSQDGGAAGIWLPMSGEEVAVQVGVGYTVCIWA